MQRLTRIVGIQVRTVLQTELKAVIGAVNARGGYHSFASTEQVASYFYFFFVCSLNIPPPVVSPRKAKETQI
jgi:hypothetical protein